MAFLFVALAGERCGTSLLTTARDKFPRWYPLLLCALRTGMRQGELLALRWRNVDFAGGFIRVDRNLVRGKLTSPKNHQRRRVDMSAQLLTDLLELRRRERARWLKEGESVPEVVFASDAGGLLDEANVRHVYARILSAAGLRHLKFHGLRHTYAALMLGSSATLTYVRDQMGHKSIQVTADVYGRFIPAEIDRQWMRSTTRRNQLQPPRNPRPKIRR